MEFLNALPAWMTVFGLIATGLVAGFGVFDVRAKSRRKEENEIEDRVIKLLKEQNEVLTVKIDDYEAKYAVLNDKVNKLEGQNQLMRDILAGRDQDSKNRIARADLAMDTISELAKVAAMNGKKTDAVMEAVQMTNKNVERLAGAIEKYLDNESKSKK